MGGASPPLHARSRAVWGPYEALAPGRYVFGFRLKTRAAGGVAARLNVFDYAASNAGGEGTLADRTVEGSTDGYQDVWLPITLATPHTVEYRVAVEPGAQVSIDRVLVIRLADGR